MSAVDVSIAEASPSASGAAETIGGDAPVGSKAFPPGWYRVHDLALKKYYYFHTGTKKTQWTKPDELTEEPPIYGKPHRPKGDSKGESKELGTAAPEEPVTSESNASKGPESAGSAADQDPDGGDSFDDGSKQGKNKLRSIFKGVANMLGLRRRGLERAAERDGQEPPTLPSAGAGAGDAQARSGAPGQASTAASSPAPSGSAGSGSASGGGGGGGDRDLAAAAGGGSTERPVDGSAAVAAVAGGSEGTPPATPPYGRAKLTRRPSILKRGGSMSNLKEKQPEERPRGLGKRRISFADQRPEGALEQTYFAENLHYSPSADHSMSFDQRGGDDNKCVIC